MKNLQANKKYYIHGMISIALMVCIRFLPPIGVLTPLGMELLGIFLGALWGWINVDMIWPSILAMVFLGFSDYTANVGSALGLAFSNGTVQLMVWLLIMAAILTTSGISDQIANRLVTWKLCKGRPWVLTIALIMAQFLCSMFNCGIPAILLIWSFIYSICDQVGFTKKDVWPRMMVVGIVFSACVGCAILPHYQGNVANFGFLAACDETLTYNYSRYIVYSLTYGLGTMVLYFLSCRFIIRPDMSKFQNEIKVGEKKPFTVKQKLAMGLIGAMVVVILLPTLLTGTAVAAFVNKFGTSAIVLVTIGIAIALRDQNGRPFFTFKELATAGLAWPMVFMVATAITIGTALATGETGVKDQFTALLLPVFEGKSPYFFACVFSLAALIITNFINNAVVSAIFIPVMYSISDSVGVNPVAMTALICFCANIGLILPCACPLGAMLNGNKEWVSQKDILVFSLVALLAMAVATCLIGVPMANLMMG